MIRYSQLYWQFFKKHLKVMMEYRLDFFIGVMSVVLIQFTSIFFVKVVFDQIEDLNGWGFYEVLFIYGVATMGRSIHHIFFDNLWTIGWQYIRPGNFDRLLIRPINPLFHLIADRVQQDGFGQLVIGGLLMAAAMPHLGVEWGPVNLLILLVLIVSSGAIFVAVNLFFATLSFWIVDSLPITFAAFNLSDFARYPLNIYHKGIRWLLTWLIPYGFTAFYPAAAFIEHSGYRELGMITPLIAVISCWLAYRFWKVGLRAFNSTGS
ncbi:ABC-2 family transporter protein [Tumebacillus sp. DT12]|uniref:ABC-2 family transporter protein n=1 Tax=Tumebacillus lacus TaxID=2995335 RepID=A0ABT3X177_9BACL|nr:ABC-2 family transporter protein [Tumebacillus lacus]MCX7570644.1 ABC-2 family transporter protein [Tumebacillus lacus]